MERTVELLSKPIVTVSNGSAHVTVPVRADPESLEKSSFFIHWGPSDGPWVDEEVTEEEIEQEGGEIRLIRKVLTPDHEGVYGLAVCAGPPTAADRRWLGGPADAVRFEIAKTNGHSAGSPLNLARTHPITGSVAVPEPELEEPQPLADIARLEELLKVIQRLAHEEGKRGLGQLLFAAAEENRTLRRHLPQYYRQLRSILSQPATPALRDAARLAFGALNTLGVGEVVFVTPEGHHASAGGLARVITGLGQALVNSGVSVTVISPLYEEAQGNRHKSAEEYIEQGVMLQGVQTPLVRLGNIKIPFGPTKWSGSDHFRRSPWTAVSQVYEASQGLMRVLFLRHRHLANRLYPEVYADEALLRAVFLSRGALELVLDSSFGIKPHIIITNDWLAGLVPALLETDPRYLDAPLLKQARTIHVIHNCGQAYQGRLFVNQYGEDLWPLLGLGDEHFFGIADPKDHRYINLTGAALYHARSAIVAVSQPYAEQLLRPEGGDGLEDLFRRKERLLFGISNGVEMEPLRRCFWEYGEECRRAPHSSSLPARPYDLKNFLKYLPLFKEASKLALQKDLDLPQQRDALIVSFIGRIAEQKGVQLLVDRLPGVGESVLERMLAAYPMMQFVVAGPPSKGDQQVERFLKHLKALQKQYPGRVCTVLDYLSHERALQLTLASNFLLMPSRYEPGGISQLEALAAGTLVVARNVGGLTATLTDYEDDPYDGNAFLFDEYDAAHLHDTMARALAMVQSKRNRRKLMRRAVFAANDWTHRADSYIGLFQHVSGVLKKNSFYPFLQPQCAVVESLRPRDE